MTMPYIIRVLMDVPDQRVPVGRLYIESCDFEFDDGHPKNERRGKAALTGDPRRAKPFESFGDAHKFWATQSTTRPVRADGKPNRPLTAYTVEIVTLDSQLGRP